MASDPAGDEAGVDGPEEGAAAMTGTTDPRLSRRIVDDGPPGLQPTLASLRRGLDELDAALASAGGARLALTDLVAGVPGDDRVLLSFLRARLAGPERRLLETLAGISEEQRALERATAELTLIFDRPVHDPSAALARLAASTGPIRHLPVATYRVPGSTDGRHRVPLRAADSRAAATSALRPAAPAPTGPPPAAGSSPLGWLSGILRGRPLDEMSETRTGARAYPDETAGDGWYEPAGTIETAAADVATRTEAAERDRDERDLAAAAAPVSGADDEPAGEADHEGAEGTDRDAALVAPETTPEEIRVEEPAAEPGQSAASALATPIATTRTRSTRPRGERRRPAGGGSRRIAGLGLAIAVPALIAMGLGGTDPGAAAGGTDGDVGGVIGTARPTGPVTSLAPTGSPAAGDELIVPLGDDHGTSGPPVGTPAPSPSGAIGSSSPTVDGPRSTRIVWHGPTDRPVVALTFDDGYNPPAVRQIFETLVRENVKATFFINGYYLSRDPALWKEIAEAGFPVGNHTYYHVDIRTLTPDDITRELKMTDGAWHRVTGTKMIPYFRPPYGAHDAASDAAVAAAGYETVVLWNVSNGDSKKGVTERAATRSALDGGNGAIILMHAGPEVTPLTLKAVIEGYRARGFEFVTIPELLGD